MIDENTAEALRSLRVFGSEAVAEVHMRAIPTTRTQERPRALHYPSASAVGGRDVAAGHEDSPRG